MLSTMQDDVPLTISRILRHGMTVHGDARITTWTGEAEPHRTTFRATGERAAQLAHALRDALGVRPEDRVATLMWNNSHHVEAYFAIPSMGGVLHTLNLRLPAEQLVFIVNHAADRVVLVNGTLLPLLAPLLPRLETVEHIVVVGPGDTSVLADCPAQVHDYEELLAGSVRPTTTGPSWTSARRRPCATPPAPPATPRASSTRTAPSTCTPCRSTWPSRWG